MSSAHPSHLAHHFDTPAQQFDSGKLGIWLFLIQEVLFFSGLFVIYSVFRANHPEIFVYAHRFLDVELGALNTAVLILSSLTAAWAVRAAQLSQQRLLVGNLLATILLACVFLSVKGVEYEHKWKEGLLWGKFYRPRHAAVQAPGAKHMSAAEAPAATTAAPLPAAESKSEEGAEGTTASNEPHNVQMFFAIYFTMTGLHALHVIAGIILFLWLLRRALHRDFSRDYFSPVDYGALYWHLVDLVWIYLFPLLYLIR